MVVVSNDVLYGDAVTSAPTATLSTRNCTPAIPVGSEAVAESVMVPLRLAPEVGDVMFTVGPGGGGGAVPGFHTPPPKVVM